MKRRQFIKTTAMAGSMMAATGYLSASGDPSKKPLNVIMIEADDLNFQTLGFMGHKVAKTPCLDKLAAQGTVFTNCIVQGTACAPSRNSLISGTYPHNTGIYMNASPVDLPENGWTFPAALRRAGVYTALYGKNHFRPFGRKDKISAPYAERNQLIRDQLGFDRAFSMGGKVALSARQHAPEKDPYAKYLHDKGIYNKLVSAYTENRRGIDIDFPLDEEDYIDSFIINSAIKWLKNKEARKDPFFLWIDLTLPHPPMDVPKKYKDLYKDVTFEPVIPMKKDGLPASLTNDMREKDSKAIDDYRRGYLALVTMMDMLIGRVVDYLDESGLRDNTIVIFMADQGSMIGHHGLYSKKYFYKGVINSPLIVSHPEYGKGKVIDRCVELLDIPKTLLTLYGCSAEDLASSHGFDFMPLLKGEPIKREFAHAEQHGVTMIQNEKFKLISYEDGDILFDLKNDPDELTNVVTKYPDIAQMLREKRDHWLAHSGEVKPSVIRSQKKRQRGGKGTGSR